MPVEARPQSPNRSCSAQVHTPETHVIPVVQAIPQAPQFAGSDEVSTQALPHNLVLPEQVTPQLPAEQT